MNDEILWDFSDMYFRGRLQNFSDPTDTYERTYIRPY